MFALFGVAERRFIRALGQPYCERRDGYAAPIQNAKTIDEALTGARATLISNDLGWEGPLVEAPWVVRNGAFFYLFYSANAYYNGKYAVGVARASSPLGPYQKAGAPILTSNGSWVGPGHCSVVDGPSGDTMMVYHAWQAGHVGGPGDGRLVLVDGIVWRNGWPEVPAAPSAGSRPLP